MRIAILSLYRYEKRNVGQAIGTYINEIYSNLKKFSRNKGNDLSIDKILLNGLKYDALSFEIGSRLQDLSDYDIVHNPIGFLRSKRGRSKYIVTIHEGELVNPLGSSLKWKIWYNFFFKAGISDAVKNADCIIAVSTQTRNELIKIGCPKNKIAITNLGIDKNFLKGSPRRARGTRTFKIGYLGSFAPNKNVEMLIEVADKVKDKDATFELWGKATEHYKTLLKKAKGNIVLKGFAPDDKIVEIYDSFDVFVFPSFYESFGIPILEAQARGLPVIVYKKGKLPMETRKFCIEAEDPEDMAQIIQDIKDNGYDDKQRKKAMDYARSFTWEKTAKETLSIYRKVLKS